MMILRAKVRRAHRAAYVSNLLRRPTQSCSGEHGLEAEEAMLQVCCVQMVPSTSSDDALCVGMNAP
jgi:hypothetical protein